MQSDQRSFVLSKNETTENFKEPNLLYSVMSLGSFSYNVLRFLHFSYLASIQSKDKSFNWATEISTYCWRYNS